VLPLVYTPPLGAPGTACHTWDAQVGGRTGRLAKAGVAGIEGDANVGGGVSLFTFESIALFKTHFNRTQRSDRHGKDDRFCFEYGVVQRRRWRSDVERGVSCVPHATVYRKFSRRKSQRRQRTRLHPFEWRARTCNTLTKTGWVSSTGRDY